MKYYDHRLIEQKWQKFWEENKTFRAHDHSQKQKFYCLDMFPYPSGAGLHVGHPLGYTATDIICRKRRHEGFEVLHPMGWDAFGLPAENYAIRTGTHPSITTSENIVTFKRQIQSLGFSYDWNREVNTTDPNYFQWTQWIFLQIFQKGLAYEQERAMAWCPSCKIVVANEEVEGGTHERCGTKVGRRNVKQWMLKITAYADRLLEDLRNPNIFLFHGWGGDSKNHWFPEAQEFFEKKNCSVFVPDFPNSEHPKYEEWKSFFEKNYGDKLTASSIVIGHSLGCQFILRYISEKNITLDHLILVSPPENDCDIPEIKNFFSRSIQGKTIQKNGAHIMIFGSENDRFIPKKDFEHLAKTIHADFIFVPHQGHFNTELVPNLLETFQSIAKNFLDWPEKIRLMQENWIGKSEGAEVKFKIKSSKLKTEDKDFSEDRVTVFTTRPDTLFGCTYFVVSPEHELITNYKLQITNYKEVQNYIEKAKNKSDLERTDLNKNKTGIQIKGLVAINPATNETIPIFVADYVLSSYGTGAIMAVPAHDERDFEFAKKYKLPIAFVVQSFVGAVNTGEVFCETGKAINSDFLNGLSTFEAKEKMIQWLEKKNIGKRKINYRLRDWIFTRQRYWGEPIPMVHDKEGNVYPLDESELPLELPKVPNYEPSESGESPLSNIHDWVDVEGWITKKGTVKILKKGEGKPAGKKIKKFFRETSTMPNWAGSSWYWLRYMDPNNEQEFCSKKLEKYWGPVDLYVGGSEHAVLHLLYARFWHKILYDLGLVSTKEPFTKLVNQGLILAEDGNKMSKSLGNVVNPDEIVQQFGADTLRMYEMFMGPFDQAKRWSGRSVEGVRRFLDRVWRVFEKPMAETPLEKNSLAVLHKTIKIVDDHIDSFRFNTAVSQLMILTNELTMHETIDKKTLEIFSILISPFVPHLAEEVWHEILGHEHSISFEPWPKFDPSLIIEDTVSYAVQVNGKLRADFEIAKDTPQAEVLAHAKSLPKVASYVSQGKIIKEIFVMNKIVGFVVK